MPLYKFGGKIIKRLGKLAKSAACCCGGPCCPDRVLPGTIYGIIELISEDEECACIDGISVPFTKTIDDGNVIEYKGSYDFEMECPVPFLGVHTVGWILTCAHTQGVGEEGFWTLSIDTEIVRCGGDFFIGGLSIAVEQISCDPLELVTEDGNYGNLGGCCSEMALEEGRYRMRFLEMLP